MNRKRLIGYTVLLILLYFTTVRTSAVPGMGDNIRFETLSTKDGLSLNTITGIFQDRNGFLWIGTQDGLNRFDGYRFKIYKHNPRNKDSIQSNFITAMVEDNDGIIWIGTNQAGLCRFDPVSETFENYRHDPENPNTIGSNTITAIGPDSTGALWLGTAGGGVNRFDPITGAIHRYQYRSFDPHSISNDFILAIYTDPSNQVWLGGPGGLDKLDPATGRAVRYLPILQKNTGIKGPISINVIFSDGKGSFVLGTHDHLLTFNAVTSAVKLHSPSQTEDSAFKGHPVIAITEDQTGHLWIGTRGVGLFRFNPETEQFTRFMHSPTMPGSISGNFISSICRDRNGLLWVGTFGAGLCKYNPGTAQFQHFKHIPGNPDSLQANYVRGICEDSKGLIWLGTSDGISRYDRQNDRFTHFNPNPANPSALSHKEIKTILEDRRGTIWIGTVRGLNRYNAETDGFEKYFHDPLDSTSLSNHFINCIALCKNSDHHLWIGTGGGGLNRFDTTTGQSTHINPNPQKNDAFGDAQVIALLEDNNGILWVGTANGLHKLNHNGNLTHFVQTYATPEITGKSLVLALHRSDGPILWLGLLGGGLGKFDTQRETFLRYGAEHGLSNDSVYGILEDKNKYLWLSTNDGLFRFNPQTEVFIRFDASDGLQSNEFNDNCYYKDRAGRFYFGGINGLNVFYPEAIIRNTLPPPTAITGFTKFNTDTALKSNVRRQDHFNLSHKDYIFTLEFAALDFTAPEKNRYAYKLEPFDKNWLHTDALNRSATYTNIPPGRYTFKVKAANNHGVWSTNETTATIHILPPFHQTMWFRLLLIVPIAFLIFLFFRYRISIIREERSKLELLVNERTEALQRKKDEVERERKSADAANRSKSDFLARMSHEIRTPMNSVIGFTEMLLDTELSEEQLDYVRTINRSGESLLTLINDIVDFSRIESGQLSLEMIDFDPEVMAFDVCELMRPRIGSRPVEIICRIAENVPSNVKGDPGRYRQVLLNLVGNAVKFTKQGEIELSIDIDDETEKSITFHALVKDTGIGIPAHKLETIFECFQQAADSTSRKYGGSGLGLAICKQIAALMQGDVWAESEAGKGSTFHFTAVLQKSGKKHVKKVTPESLAGKKVLVVDDNKNNLDILTHLLSSAEMEVVTLTRGRDVLPILYIANKTRSPFDLCILDIHMPDISGYEVARNIRKKDSPSPDLPLLAFTSTYSKKSHLFVDAGFDGFLPKPVQGSKLIEMLEQLLGKSKIDKEEATERKEIVTQYSIIEEVKQSTRILLAEDNPINQKLATFLLQKAGYQVEVANNGKEALELFTQAPHKFDMIFMDVQMPEMDGKEASRTIRSMGFDKIPIIAMTAQAMKGDREKCLDAGMSDYIAKPIKREAVFKMVKKWAMSLNRQK